MINYAVLHFCPSPKKHVYMHDELLLCSWRLTMSEEEALSVRFREPKTFCEEENWWRNLFPLQQSIRTSGPCQFLVNGNLLGQ